MSVQRRGSLVIQSYRGNGVIDCGKICKFENEEWNMKRFTIDSCGLLLDNQTGLSYDSFEELLPILNSLAKGESDEGSL